MGMSPGCLYPLDGAVPGHRPRAQDWQQGIVVGFYAPGGEAHAVYPLSIVDGRDVFDGVVYEADEEAVIVDALNASAGDAGEGRPV